MSTNYYDTGNDTTQTDIVEIYADDSIGTKLFIPMEIRYNPNKLSTEQAIIRAFGSGARTFDEFVIEQGWRHGYWTFPNTVSRVKSPIY